MDKFHHIIHIAKQEGVHTQPLYFDEVQIIPLFGWYDYSFGEPSPTLQSAWMDYGACKWETGMTEKEITQSFLARNIFDAEDKKYTISFSHFLPRVDILPPHLPPHVQALFPVFESTKLEEQLRQTKSNMHIYGHHHLNRHENKEGISYINNAFGYPSEHNICRKQLLQVW